MPLVLIHFFGASVTAQGRHHQTGDITGYYPHVVESFKEIYPSAHVIRTSAGSSHFNDAGYCLLDEVIETNPDIIVFDWHSTSLESFDSDLFAAAVGKVKRSGSHLLLSILPRRASIGKHLQLPCIMQAYEALSDSVHILDLYNEPMIIDSIDELLRDECHTTLLGAKVYSQFLVSKICEILAMPAYHGRSLQSDNPLVPVSKLELADDYVHASEIQLIVKPGGSARGSTLVLDHKVGPYSPVVEIKTGQGYLKSFSLWDPYCHYERQNYIALPGRYGSKSPESLSVQISVSNKLPLYELARNKDYDFSSVTSRYMRPRVVYCIGGDILSFELT